MKWRIRRSFPVGRAIVERMGEIENLAMCEAIEHGSLESVQIKTKRTQLTGICKMLRNEYNNERHVSCENGADEVHRVVA